jgi:hypothetical protein
MGNIMRASLMAQMAAALVGSGMLVRETDEGFTVQPEKPEPPMPNGVVLVNDLKTYPITETGISKLTSKTARTIFDVERMVKAEAKRKRRADNQTKG